MSILNLIGWNKRLASVAVAEKWFLTPSASLSPLHYQKFISCQIYWLKAVDVCQKLNSYFCKVFTFYAEKLEDLLYETEVHIRFHHNLLYISQAQHPKARVSNDSNKQSFAVKLFQFCDIETQQRFIL